MDALTLYDTSLALHSMCHALIKNFGEILVPYFPSQKLIYHLKLLWLQKINSYVHLNHIIV